MSSYDADAALTMRITHDVDDAFIWAEHVTFYTDGEATLAGTLYDDGVQRTDTFESGVRAGILREDLDDAHAWHTISDRFVDGVRVSRDVVYDDDLIG